MASTTPMKLPATSRAWVRPVRGPIATHLRLESLPTPEAPGADSDEVLVRISSVALEFSMGSLMPLIPALPYLPPLIPEMSFSGTVVAAGARAPAEVREAGARVMGFQAVPSVMLMGKGVLREHLRISGACVARMPDSMAGDAGMDHAAAIIGSLSTALKINRTAGVKAGDRVLVNGASGAVGNLVVQLAHRRGAHVVAVASARNEQFVRGVGADEFVDYTAHTDLAAHLGATYGAMPFDHVLDCVGVQSLYDGSPAYMKPEGRFINVGAMQGMLWTLLNWLPNMYRPVWLGGVPRTYIMFSTIPTRDDLILMLKMVDDGEVQVNLDSVWEMEDVAKGYERVTSARSRGKVIVKVQREQ